MNLSELLSGIPAKTAEVTKPVDEPVAMEKLSMMKQAAVVIRTLQGEVDDLKTKLASYDNAMRIAKKLAESEELETEELLQKISEFKNKSNDELAIIEKAIDLVKNGGLEIGRVSNDPEAYNLDPLTSYLLSNI